MRTKTGRIAGFGGDMGVAQPGFGLSTIAGQRRAWKFNNFALLGLFIAAVLIFPGKPALAQSGSSTSVKPVPKAHCGPQDRPETGLQGQTTNAERFSGASEKAYNCNLELVGQVGAGSGFDLADFGTCGYYPPSSGGPNQHRGTTVVDASDPKNLRIVGYLESPAMLAANESLATSPVTKLLAAVSNNGPEFDLYDLSADCTHPVLKATISLAGGFKGHAGNFSPDGRTYYATDFTSRPNTFLVAIDVSNSAKPREIARWAIPTEEGDIHHVTLNEDGTRAYIGLYGGWPDPSIMAGGHGGANGLAVVDVSDIQSRKANPQFRVVSKVTWTDGGGAQMPFKVMIKGRPYLVMSDAGVPGGSGLKGAAASCANKMSPYGYARMFDISDEKNPKLISKLNLEVDDPTNCSKVLDEPIRFIGYSSVFCIPDNAKDTKMVACAYYEAGLRVFDVRDPIHPREVAYYKPPAMKKDARKDLPETSFQSGTADAVNIPSTFRMKGTEIWISSQVNGFQIVRFTDRFQAAEKGLFQGQPAGSD